MKIRFTYDHKKDEIDWFVWRDPGPIPPVAYPADPDTPKDGAPPEPEKPEPKPS
jgi:hypothetical protein